MQHRTPVRALAAACGTLALTAPTADAFFPDRGNAPASPLAGTLAGTLRTDIVDDALDVVRARAEAAAERRAIARAAHPPKGGLRLRSDGTVVVPEHAPAKIRRLLHAANRIAKKPYIYGGGHGSFESAGYDCSGSLSYALHAAGALDVTMASGALMGYGRAGEGRWVTVYSNPGHAYMTVAGLRFDTTAFKATGSRWTTDDRPQAGYVVRHPKGL